MMRTAEGNYQEDYHNDENVEKSDQLNDSIISCISNDTSGFSRTNSQTSTSTLTATEDNGLSPDASPLLGWPMRKPIGRLQATLTRRVMKQRSCCPDEKYAEHDSGYQDDADNVEMMKERFAKLLLGEDMSGCGKGVCTAVAISNAITNLFATAFSQLYRLEPLNIEKRLMWKREMNWLLAICDHIVEFVPSWQTLPDGRKQEVMVSQIRCDIQINIPALQKLDAMLIGILDSFCNTDFWYVDQGAGQSDNEELGTMTPRQEQKWWLPTPRVPPRGLSDKSKKLLQKQRYCANQILKAALAINSSVLAEMEVPSSYTESLPKTGKSTLGDGLYKQITNPDHFSPDDILDTLDLKSEHSALEIANKVEAAIYVWKRKGNLCHVKSSWDLMKDFMVDGEKMEMLTERAKSLLLMLKLRCPQLSQTSLDTSKIQYNKDVGQAILESYSRVLESFAHNVVALVDDILFADESFRLSSSGKLLKMVPSASPKVLEVTTGSLQDLASSSLRDLKVSG